MIRLPPLPPHKRLGAIIPAGLGYSTVLADFDYETKSAAGMVWVEDSRKWILPPGAGSKKKGLNVVGSAKYSEHPSTDVLTLAYDLKEGVGPRVWLPGMPNPEDLFEHIAKGGLLEAWNVAFERLIWLNVCRRRYGWPDLPMNQLRCAMAKARAHGLPGKLGVAGEVMNLSVQKDKEGDRLIKKFSMPQSPTKKQPLIWINLTDDVEDGWKLITYNIDDIRAEAAVSAVCPDLVGEELEFWLADQAINHRGVHVDRKGVEDCIEIIKAAHEQYNAELYSLTGGRVARASELAKLKTWLAEQGCVMDEMDEDAIDARLSLSQAPPPDIAKYLDLLALEADEDRLLAAQGRRRVTMSAPDPMKEEARNWRPPAPLAPQARRALEIRRAVGSASVKKVFAMKLQMCDDDRLRELFSYHAARTGRPTGNGPQPTNLPKAGPNVYRCGCSRYSSNPKICTWCNAPRAPSQKTGKIETVEWCVAAVRDALQVIGTHDLRTVEYHYGDAMLAVSGCLRGLFNAAPGHDLVSSDFTAIEAVVLAALAGETWRMEVFRRPKSDIYVESISRSTGTPVEEILKFKEERGMHHPLRAKGKIQELSLGYGGWLGALRAFGAQGTDDELKRQILSWREASPNIVNFWGGQSRNFGREPGMFGLEGAAITAVLNPGTWYDVTRADGSRTGISYGMKGDVLYCQLPSDRYLAYHRPRLRQTGTWRGYALTFEGYNTNPKKGAPGWRTMDLYGGLLAENVTQAVARDIQRHAIVNLEKKGYPVVLHVYDEDVAEVPHGFGSIEGLEQIMATMPPWAQGWPIKAAGGWRSDRYQKA